MRRFSGLGPLELVIVLVIVLVILGGKRLPQLGRPLGGGLREFKDSVTSKADKHFDDDGDRRRRRPGGARPSGRRGARRWTAKCVRERS